MRKAIAERVDGLLNPILLKEVRQGFRGRGLLLGGGAALLLGLAAFALAALGRHPDGKGLFVALSVCMAVMMLVVIPLGVGWQLHKEIEDRTLELIAITSLGPWRNVAGRALGGVVKLLLTVALMGPFMMAAVLLGGVGFGDVLSTLGFDLACAILFGALSLMLAALGTVRSGLVRMAANLRYVVVPLAAWGLLLVDRFALGSSRGGGELAFRLSFPVAMVVLAGLFLSAAADLLTPPWVRSYARSKLLAAAVVLGGAALPALLEALSVHVSDALAPVLCVLAQTLLLSFSTFWAGSQLPDRRAAGGGRAPREAFFSTMLYAGAVGAACLAISATACTGRDRRVLVALCATAGAYFLLFGGAARLVRRVLRRRHPALFPVLVGALTAAALLASIVVAANGRHPKGLARLLAPAELLDLDEYAELGVLLLPLALGLGLGWLGREPRAARAAAPAEAAPGHG